MFDAKKEMYEWIRKPSKSVPSNYVEEFSVVIGLVELFVDVVLALLLTRILKTKGTSVSSSDECSGSSCRRLGKTGKRFSTLLHV